MLTALKQLAPVVKGSPTACHPAHCREGIFPPLLLALLLLARACDLAGEMRGAKERAENGQGEAKSGQRGVQGGVDQLWEGGRFSVSGHVDLPRPVPPAHVYRDLHQLLS